MTEKHEYSCGCLVEFDDSGQGKMVNLCEACLNGTTVRMTAFDYSKYDRPKWKK